MSCRVQSCCGCCSVRVGAIIVGVLYLIFAVAGDIVLAVIDIVGVLTATTPSNGVATPSNSSGISGTGGNNTGDGNVWTKITIATWVELGVDVLFLIICVLLIVGAAKNNRVLCMIWLVAAGLWTAFMAGEAVYLTVERYLLDRRDLDALWQTFLDTLIVKWGAVVVWLLMLIAGAVVVSSHVADIRDDKDGPLLAEPQRSYPT